MVSFGFEFIESILISLSGTLYSFIGWLYKLFLYIASARIIKNDVIENFMKRIMVIIGVVTLFLLAVSLIKSIINPEKEVKNTSKIFVNVITSIVMLVLVNTFFNYLYEAQGILLKSNVIGKIVLGGSPDFDEENIGTNMAVDTFAAFFTDDPYAAAESADEDIYCRNSQGDKIEPDDLAKYLETDDCYYSTDDYFWIDTDYMSINQVKARAKKYDQIVKSFQLLKKPADEGVIEFSFLMSLICGGFIVYIFISFCLDIAVRCAKLAVLQIISPIAIMSRIIPGQESIFNNWIKKTMTAFMEVFIKIAIIFFGIYLISSINDLSNLVGDNSIIKNPGFTISNIGYIAIIVGILMFVKQAPGYISDIFGIKSENMKLGIKDKLASAGIFAGGAAVGAFATQGIRNFRDGYSNGRADGRGRLRSALSGIKSGTAGSISAGVRAGYNGRSAKGLKDMKGAASTGTANAAAARDKRREFKEQHGGTTPKALMAHFKNAGENIIDWTSNDQAEYSRLEKKYNSLNDTNSKVKAIDSKATDWVDKQANNIRINKFKYKDIDGKDTDYNGEYGYNLGVIRNIVNQAKERGVHTVKEWDAQTGQYKEVQKEYTAAELTNLDKMLFAAEKQAKKDFVVGKYNSMLNTRDSIERESLLKDLQTSIADQTHLDSSSATKPNEVKNINLSNANDVAKMYDDIKDDLDKQLYTTQSEMNQISEKNRKKKENK